MNLGSKVQLVCLYNTLVYIWLSKDVETTSSVGSRGWRVAEREKCKAPFGIFSGSVSYSYYEKN